MNDSEFLSCDWGSSSFRLRWVQPGLTVARECKTSVGCKTLYDRALSLGLSRAELYERTLAEHLGEWESFAEKPLPLVVSGMASSTIGWQDVPYLNGPLNLDGSNLRFETIHWPSPRWINKTFLISGVTIYPEIMRGEEVEAIGVISGLPQSQGLLLLPGTHSKHLQIEHGAVSRISTYMTGELFEVMAKHSLLKASVEGGSAFDSLAFKAGIAWVKEHGLARSLFRVRTRAVLDAFHPTANAWFLSGVLIGAELHDLAKTNESNIILAGAGELGELYSRALDALDVSPHRWMQAPVTITSNAVIAAHAMFLRHRL
jgi:2-dehydro-3-deoxygalactonokinase